MKIFSFFLSFFLSFLSFFLLSFFSFFLLSFFLSSVSSSSSSFCLFKVLDLVNYNNSGSVIVGLSSLLHLLQSECPTH